jgi:hypothetical protein
MTLVLKSDKTDSPKGNEHSITETVRTATGSEECPNCAKIAAHVRDWVSFESRFSEKNDSIEIARWEDFQKAANCAHCRKLVNYFKVGWPSRAGQSHPKDVFQISAARGRLTLRIAPVRLAFL